MSETKQSRWGPEAGFIPSALSGGDGASGLGFQSFTASMFGGPGTSWFDSRDCLASNRMLPLGGLGISAVAGLRLNDVKRCEAIADGSQIGATLPLCRGWLRILRDAVPVAIALVMLHAIGAI